jgi:drug/metabolite transporter (DMT)-like permease
MFTPAPRNNALAATLILTASAFVAVTTLLAKALGTDTLGPALPAFQISHGRFLFAFIAIVTVVAWRRPTFSRPNWTIHIGRTVLGWSGVTLMFASVAYIPVADATAISFLNPVFCMLFAIPLLGEHVGKWRWLAAAIALSGAFVLLRPTPGNFQPAALLALGAAVIMGVELILMKKLTGRESPLQILTVNNALGLTLATCVVIPVWQVPTSQQWIALAFIGFFMAAAQACYVNALARADASFVAPFSYATLVFAALYDAIIFDHVPDGTSILGAVIILTGAALLAWREGRAKSA